LPFKLPEPNLLRATERAYSWRQIPPLDLGVARCSAARLRGFFLQLQPRRHQL
jgi:hypothetical protein